MSCDIPDYLTKEIVSQVEFLQTKIEYKKLHTNNLVRKTSSRVKEITGANAIFFWIEKAVNALRENSDKNEEIFSLSLKKEMLLSVLDIEDEIFISSQTIKSKQSILNKRLVSAEFLYNEKIEDIDKKQLEVQSYAIAFENQLASVSLISSMRNDDSRNLVLNSISSMSSLFIPVSETDKKKKKSRKKEKSLGFENLGSKVKSFTKKVTPKTDTPVVNIENDSSIDSADSTDEIKIPSFSDIEFEFEMPLSNKSNKRSATLKSPMKTLPLNDNLPSEAASNDTPPADYKVSPKRKKRNKKKGRKSA
jgi:hypothetical protein